MSKNKPIKPADNQSNMQNPNKGTSGTNRQYDQNQGNRGEQLNPNKKGKSCITKNESNTRFNLTLPLRQCRLSVS